jgi:hypothetical protein
MEVDGDGAVRVMDACAGVDDGVEAGVRAGVEIVATGVVERLLSPPNAFLNLPLNPFFSGSTGVVTVFESGDGRGAGGVLAAALEMGPV